MKQDLFKYLPLEITIDVLLRLPVRSIACCKCVCKSWLRLLETNEFAKTHLSKSLPGLLIHGEYLLSTSYIDFDLEDGPYLQSQVNNTVTKLNLPDLRVVRDSSDGLLFLRDHKQIYICNPITRDCMELNSPQEFDSPPSWVTYGFGKSKITGQHKLVKISGYLETSKSECQVYTLGTGSWRTIAPEPTSWYHRNPPAFVNGNLHWLAFCFYGIPWVSCFNLETEHFSTFSTPILTDKECIFDVCTFGNYLCFYTYTLDNESMETWLMKDYGVENSWAKVEDESFFIGSLNNYGFCAMNPSFRRITNELIQISGRYTIAYATFYTPSFLSLKSFNREKLCSF